MPDTSDTSATGATRMKHGCGTSDTSETRVRHERHECNTNATRVLHKRHECDASATRVKHFDFDNDTSKNIFSHPYIYYMASERLQGEEQFHSIKKCTTKTNHFNGKNISKRCALDCTCKCPCTLPHSYAQ